MCGGRLDSMFRLGARFAAESPTGRLQRWRYKVRPARFLHRGGGCHPKGWRYKTGAAAIRSSERAEFAGRNSPGAQGVVHTEIERRAEERDRCRNALFSRTCGVAIRNMDFALE